MRRWLPLLSIVLLLSPGVRLHADDLVYGRFGDYLESLRSQAGIPGLTATVIGPSDVVWERTFGQQDVDRAIATRGDTPFHADGVMQLLTASLALRCVEEGRLSLDDQVGTLNPSSPEPAATIRQLLTHTSGSPSAPVFSYRTERLDALAPVIAACAGAASFRAAVAGLLDRLAMADSVPGPDVVTLSPPADGLADSLARYQSVLARLATPYSVSKGKASVSRYTQSTLTPASGLITTVRDMAKFDLALKKGVLLRPDTLGQAWTPPLNASGQRLPHALGWFAQSYNGETVVWQFGVSDNASSSLVLTVPSRGLTLVLLANSDGLTRPFALNAGDVTASPFAGLFLGVFVR